jgi:hypothetical protein
MMETTKTLLTHKEVSSKKRDEKNGGKRKRPLRTTTRYKPRRSRLKRSMPVRPTKEVDNKEKEL